jgi:hypothetical protein
MGSRHVTPRVMVGLRDRDNLRERLEAAAALTSETLNSLVGRLVEVGLAERGFGRPQSATAARRARKAA